MPTPSETSLTVNARCLGPFAAGTYVPLACFVTIDATNAPSTNRQAFADLRIFGGAEKSGIVKCPACGLPTTFDLDIHIPKDMTPDVKTFAVWAKDDEGRTGTATASLEIRAR